jgi:uncharacterized membrane protein (DUF4010 family)
MHEFGNTFDGPVGMRLVLALALGFLVGLERESARADNRRLIFGGVRTFPIVSLFGFACAWLQQLGVGWMMPGGLLATLVLSAVSYASKLREGRLGVTSEISALLTYVVGAMTLLTDIRLAMALGVINTILLSEKSALEALVERVDKVEFLATLRFLLVTFIIYPVLPDTEFTAYHLNPARIWRVVIMVSSFGFVGYFLVKKFGHRTGLWLSGLLGGIVSSTAASIMLGRMVQHQAARAVEALQAALLAGSMMYLRILVLVGLFNFALAEALAWRLAALAALGLLLAASARGRPTAAVAPEPRPTPVRNPFEIQTALVFALLFVALTVLTQLVKTHFGYAGVLSLAGFSGLVDVDPFTLSLAQHPITSSPLTLQLILVALMSNTLMKGIYFGALAQPIRRGALLRYLLWVAAHLPLLGWC